MAITLRSGSLSGTQTNTTITVTLPTYQLTDYIILIISSNNGNAQTFGANVTATSVGSASNRLNAWRIVPIDGSQTSFTVTVSVSSVFTWWIGAYQNVNLLATVYGTGSNIGSNTTSPIAPPTVTAGYIATGSELVISAASVNSTATWTTSGSTIYNTTTGNAALMVNGNLLTAGSLSVVPAAMDRGLSGTTRNESAVTIILPTTPSGTTNLLANPSFELGTAVATSWEAEDNAVGTPAYTVQTTGVIDGLKAQKMEYAGTVGDAGQFFAVYQAPIDASPGDLLEFSIYVSGSKSNCNMIVGIEAFQTGGIYISEHDTVVSSLTGTPTLYTVQYTCPVGTDYVAAYIQVNELISTSTATVYMDKATLVLTSPATNKGAFFGLF